MATFFFIHKQKIRGDEGSTGEEEKRGQGMLVKREWV